MNNNLNEILKGVKYTQNLYANAAERTHNKDVKKKLEKSIGQRKDFADEIEEIIINNGYTVLPEKEISVFDRLGLFLNDLFIQKNADYILKECIKADKALINDYHDFINSTDVDEVLTKMMTDHSKQIKKQVSKFEKQIEKYPWA